MTMRSNALMTSMHSLTAKTKLVGLASLAAGVLLAGLLAASPARAALLECPTASTSFGICPNSFTSSSANSQAGAHSDFTTAFQLNTDDLGNTAGQLKNVSISLPPGEVGNPQAIPHCTDNEFQDFNCPVRRAGRHPQREPDGHAGKPYDADGRHLRSHESYGRHTHMSGVWRV